MTEIERFKTYIKYKKFKYKELADLLETSSVYIGEVLSNKGELSKNLISKMINKAEFKDLNWDWLLTGEGEMLKQQQKLPFDFQSMLKETVHKAVAEEMAKYHRFDSPEKSAVRKTETSKKN